MHSSDSLTLLWLRRDLRLHDHAGLHHALAYSGCVQPVFIFDEDILRHFPDRHDRRLSFITASLIALDTQLQRRGGGLLALHGKASEIMPRLAVALKASQLVAAEDYEPATRARDAAVGQALEGARLQLVKDQVIFSPEDILRDTGEPYKVFTPYAHNWRSKLTPVSAAPYSCDDMNRYADHAKAQAVAQSAGFNVVPLRSGAKAALAGIGYDYADDPLWPVDGGGERLTHFIAGQAKDYAQMRDVMAANGTSRLSPYLRFGLVSVRECVRAALDAGADKWLSELIWREFYAMILYHYPESVATEWNPKYRERLRWADNPAHLEAWKQGKTGYPLVDAAMRQLLEEGWMHNRARMVVASFLTKHLRISWREGEAHFAQHLMDYELASNVGGWQWAASTGTDAQPYFRVFNPTLQSEKFDPRGEYIRRYVPELKDAPVDVIHAPWKHPLLVKYYTPLVDHATARMDTIHMFKELD